MMFGKPRRPRFHSTARAFRAVGVAAEEAAESIREANRVFDEMTWERYEQLGMPYGESPEGLQRWVAENPEWLDRWAEEERLEQGPADAHAEEPL